MTIHTTVGLLLGFLGLAILTAAWWQEARRADRHELALAEQRAELDDLHVLIADHLELTPMEDPPPTEPMAVAAVTPAVAQRREQAWDTAAQTLRPVPYERAGRHRA